MKESMKKHMPNTKKKKDVFFCKMKGHKKARLPKTKGMV